MEIRQNADGSSSFVRESDAMEMGRAGAVAGAAGSNTPAFANVGSMTWLLSGGTDTAGGLLGWKNTLGYDIEVVGAVLSVSTVATGACTVSFGQTGTNATTSASNMISGQDTHTATGQFTSSAPLAVKVAQNTWITGSQASGATSGMVGKFIVQYVPLAGAALG